MDSLFSIWKVDRDEALRIAESTYIVHVHDFEELIVGVKGGIEHTINCELTLAEAPLVAFVAKGQPHKLTLKLVNDEFDMWVIRFKSEFIADTIFQHYQSFMQRPNIALESGTCFNRLGLLCSLIDAEMKNTAPDLSVVRHLLSALFLMIEAEKLLAIPINRLLKLVSSSATMTSPISLGCLGRRPARPHLNLGKRWLLFCPGLLKQ